MGRTPFGSPTLSDQALMSFPSMKIGPGKSSRSHTADEFIFVKEIEEAIALYLDLLDGAMIRKERIYLFSQGSGFSFSFSRRSWK